MNQITQKVYLNYLQPELALPRTSALLFAGTALYVGFIDPVVRSRYDNARLHLSHWSGVSRVSNIATNILAGVTSILGLNAYRVTQQPLWLAGSLAMLSIIPLSYLTLNGIGRELEDDNRNAAQYIDSSRSEGILSKIGSWVWRHRIQTVISLGAAVMFYLAQNKASVPQPVVKLVVVK